jgi:hypothetical protein
MTKEELILLSRKAFRKFYLRPKIILSHLSWMVKNPQTFFNYFSAVNAYVKTVVR